MKRKIRLLRILPILKPIFEWLFQNFLTFTDVPKLRGDLNLLLEERNAYMRYSQNPDCADKWHLQIIDLLVQKSVTNFKLQRIGSVNDGGYFIPAQFIHGQVWICIGLGYNIEFENELASQNCQIICFDHTIDGRPKRMNKKISYFEKGWGSISDSKSKGNLITLNEILNLVSLNKKITDFAWCLKFDIEGNEWECINQIVEQRIKPDVIVCEMHGLLWGSPYSKSKNIIHNLQMLLRDYFICYMNGNNYSPHLRTKKYELYDIIEVTLIHKKYVNNFSRKKLRRHPILVKNNPTVEQMQIQRL